MPDLIYREAECAWGPLDGSFRTLRADDVLIVVRPQLIGKHIEISTVRTRLGEVAKKYGARYLGCYVVGARQTPHGSTYGLVWVPRR